MEVNPNHEMTAATRDQWHKIAMLIMLKLGVNRVELTEADLHAVPTPAPSIVIEGKPTSLVVRIVSQEEGRELARKAGGLPN